MNSALNIFAAVNIYFPKLKADKKPSKLRPLILPTIVSQREATKKANQSGLWLRFVRASVSLWSTTKLVSRYFMCTDSIWG